MTMPFEKIDYALEAGVAFIRLNEPETLNAMTVQMGEELNAAVDLAGKEARALVIGSAGRAFSSGANLTDGAFDLDDPQRDAGGALESTFNPLMLKLRAAPIPVVTAVRGAAAGIGCAIALMGDVIVAGEGAYFLQAFRRVGLVPDGGSTYLLAKAIGRVRAMEMMLLGDKLPAAKALDWGLITRLVPDEAVDTTAFDIARELAAGPTRALALIRQSAWAALETGFEAQIERERADQRSAGRTEDFIEGVHAFLEKRPARFRGD